MIVRLIAIDPRPRDPRRDVVVYQVPENSREMGLLTELFDAAGIEWDVIAIPRRRKKEIEG